MAEGVTTTEGSPVEVTTVTVFPLQHFPRNDEITPSFITVHIFRSSVKPWWSFYTEWKSLQMNITRQMFLG